MATYKHKDLTEQIIQAFYKVYNKLGYGFAEALYENAIAYELRGRNVQFEQQAGISVYYDGHVIGGILR